MEKRLRKEQLCYELLHELFWLLHELFYYVKLFQRLLKLFHDFLLERISCFHK